MLRILGRFCFVLILYIAYAELCHCEIRNTTILSIKHDDNPNQIMQNKQSLIDRWNDLSSGFMATVYVVLISELGDKTFFIAAILAMRHPRCQVYCGAMFALATMTILSAILGYATTLIPRKATIFAAGVLYFIFGMKMLYDGYKMPKSAAKEEFEEVNLQLSQSKYVDLEVGNTKKDPEQNKNCLLRVFGTFLSPIFIETFVLTFLAEWGDRSQIATIALAATKNSLGVIFGGIFGHSLCTGFAVLMGRFVAQKIPIQWITFIGGITFLIFAFNIFFNGADL